MSLLTDEEIRKWWASENGLEDCQLSKLDDFHKATRAYAAALLAKLASAELPPLPAYECGPHTGHAAVRTDESIRAYGRQAYAQGAAAQLSAEPVGSVYNNHQGSWAPLKAYLKDGEPLYTRRQA